jgi:hypothetical protein
VKPQGTGGLAPFRYRVRQQHRPQNEDLKRH